MEIVYQNLPFLYRFWWRFWCRLTISFLITCWLSTLEPPRGLEPRTYSLRMSCSTNWAMVAIWFSAIYIAIQSILAQFLASKPATHALRMRCSTNWATMARALRLTTVKITNATAKVLLFSQICKCLWKIFVIFHIMTIQTDIFLPFCQYLSA